MPTTRARSANRDPKRSPLQEVDVCVGDRHKHPQERHSFLWFAVHLDLLVNKCTWIFNIIFCCSTVTAYSQRDRASSEVAGRNSCNARALIRPRNPPRCVPIPALPIPTWAIQHEHNQTRPNGTKACIELSDGRAEGQLPGYRIRAARSRYVRGIWKGSTSLLLRSDPCS